MTNTKHTKRALLASVLSLLLCISMLVGSTFAWFTDSATTGVSNIVAGTLDIALYTDEDCTVPAEMLSFKKAAGHESEAVLFEPGAKYELTQVWLKNDGNLHAKYQVVINGVSGNDKLAEVLDVIIDGQNMGTLKNLVANAGIVKEHHIAPGEKQTFGKIELMMQTSANNDYQGKTIDGISITVLATQYTAEYDSKDNQYDAGAQYPVNGDVWDGTVNTEKDPVTGLEATKVPDPLQVPVLDANGDPVMDAETGAPVTESEKLTDANNNNKTYDVIRINTAEELAALAVEVNAGKDHVNSYFILEQDLDLMNIEWTPIGTAETPFYGNFDGNGHTIYNLKVTDDVYAGLFGFVTAGGSNYRPGIENLTIENVTITGATNGGAFIGNAATKTNNAGNGGVIELINNKLTGKVIVEGVNVGSVSGGSWANVQRAYSDITVDVSEDSYVKGTNSVGGVFGDTVHGWVNNVTSNIDVIGEGAAVVGGISGQAGWQMRNVTFTGDVTVNNVPVSADGKYTIGLIVGKEINNSWWWLYNDGSGSDFENFTAEGTLAINLTDGTASTSNGMTAEDRHGTDNAVDYSKSLVGKAWGAWKF